MQLPCRRKTSARTAATIDRDGYRIVGETVQLPGVGE